MSNQKITELKSLNALTISDADLIPVVDVDSSASPTGETKNISIQQFVQRVTNDSLDQIDFIMSDTAKLHHSHSIDDVVTLRETLNSFISSSQIGQPDGVVPLNSDSRISLEYLPAELSGSNFVTKVFGRSGDISAESGDYDAFYVPLVNVGSANGVAGLDAGSKVSTSNLPVGDVNGVAALDAQGKVPLDQLPDLVTGSFPVTQYNGRTGAIVPISSDYSSFYVSQSGGTLTGPLNVLITPTQPSHSVSKAYVDTISSSFLSISGGTMTGYTNVPIEPTQPSHSVSKAYVDRIGLGSNGVFKFSEEIGGGRRSFDSMVYIDKEYNIRAMGKTTSSKFGPINAYSPAVSLPIGSGENVNKVYCNQYNVICLTDDGNVFSTGRNSQGQCGIAGSYNNTIGIPTSASISNCKSIGMSGDEDSRAFMFLTNNGEVYSCGINTYGQLGNGTTTNTNASGPSLVLGPGNIYGNPSLPVEDVIGAGGDGYETFCALLNNGQVYMVGFGGRGQMGNGTTTSTNTTWKNVVVTGGLTSLTNVSKIKCGGPNNYTTFYGLTTDNKLYAWGNNTGSIGDGTSVLKNQATLVDSSVSDFWVFTRGSSGIGNTSVFIKRLDGNIYATGNNTHGNLGVGDTSTKTSFTHVSSLAGINIEKIYSGTHFNGPTVWAKESGSNNIYVAGYNSQYQHGMGDNINRTTFVKVPFKTNSKIIDINSEFAEAVGGFTCILTEDGDLFHTGQARWGFTSDSTNRCYFSKVTNIING